MVFSKRAKQLRLPQLTFQCSVRPRHRRQLFSVISLTLLLGLQNECECKKGFRGNGIDCELITSCLEQTGRCHPLVSYLIFFFFFSSMLLKKITWRKKEGWVIFFSGPSKEQNLFDSQRESLNKMRVIIATFTPFQSWEEPIYNCR